MKINEAKTSMLHLAKISKKNLRSLFYYKKYRTCLIDANDPAGTPKTPLIQWSIRFYSRHVMRV